MYRSIAHAGSDGFLPANIAHTDVGVKEMSNLLKSNPNSPYIRV